MEPQIRYVSSADGTKLATATVGSGPDLVMPLGPTLTSVEAQWAIAPERAVIEHIARRYRLIRFDPRGMGLSDRHPEDLSLSAYADDLEAVVSSLPSGSAFLFSRGAVAPGVIAFAARHPERVRRLALRGASPRGSDYSFPAAHTATIEPLMDVDWNLYCQMLALVTFGWTETGKEYSAIISRSTAPDVVRRLSQALREQDASDELSSVRCPTLLIYEPHSSVTPPETVRHMASVLPDARLRPFGLPAAPVPRGLGLEMLDIVLAFFDEHEAVAAPETAARQGTVVILFADIVDSTALTERMGDAAFRERARALDGALRAAIRAVGGTTIDAKTLGDGVLATFPAASQAIAAALACASAGNEADLSLHVGLHAGDVIREEGNVFGGAVNIAARISALSAPGEVLVSDIVRGLARTSAGVTFEDRGEHMLKGVAERQRVFAVRAASA